MRGNYRNLAILIIKNLIPTTLMWHFKGALRTQSYHSHADEWYFRNITSCETRAVFTCEAVEGGGDEEVLVMRRMEEVIVVE